MASVEQAAEVAQDTNGQSKCAPAILQEFLKVVEQTGVAAERPRYWKERDWRRGLALVQQYADSPDTLETLAASFRAGPSTLSTNRRHTLLALRSKLPPDLQERFTPQELLRRKTPLNQLAKAKSKTLEIERLHRAGFSAAAIRTVMGLTGREFYSRCRSLEYRGIHLVDKTDRSYGARDCAIEQLQQAPNAQAAQEVLDQLPLGLCRTLARRNPPTLITLTPILVEAGYPLPRTTTDTDQIVDNLRRAHLPVKTLAFPQRIKGRVKERRVTYVVSSYSQELVRFIWTRGLLPGLPPGLWREYHHPVQQFISMMVKANLDQLTYLAFKEALGLGFGPNPRLDLLKQAGQLCLQSSGTTASSRPLQ